METQYLHQLKDTKNKLLQIQKNILAIMCHHVIKTKQETHALTQASQAMMKYPFLTNHGLASIMSAEVTRRTIR